MATFQACFLAITDKIENGGQNVKQH